MNISLKVELLPLESVFPSAYNPREANPERLELLTLSLRKLGFIQPLYADAGGELLSGHQRHLCAGRLGIKTVPVVRLGSLDLPARKSLNITFNRGTNDLRNFDTTGTITAFLKAHDPREMARNLPDCPPERFYRCGDFGKFELADACSYSFQPFDLAVCYLFFQFIPLESRRPLLLNLIGRVKRSGAIILVDKMFPPEQSRHTPDIFRRITLSAKRDNGAPPDEILSKELSLGGVQRPVSLDCITAASPLAYEFFRFGEFSGWVIPGSDE